ncbi:hypothetical protein GJ496_009879 [Pomphorhynchus laevis]|nr:hypothetical protein GJ496_009879 [Pomphorhynchus laevis]
MKLTYFNGSGKAELARLVLAVAKVPYEFVGISFNNWDKFKSTTPIGQVPFLEFTSEGSTIIMPQSIAIARYLAKEHNLAGKNNLESALIDVVVDTVADILNYYFDVIYHLTEEEKITQMPILRDQRIPEAINNFKKLMNMYNPSGKTPYFIGDQLSLADLYVFNSLEHLSTVNPTVIEECEVIKKNRDAVASIPTIVEYMKTRGY